VDGTAWLIMPTFNEAENIEKIVAAAREALAGAVGDAYKILIVDDSSPDGTGRIADRIAAEHDEVSVLHRAEREGLGPAYIAGFRSALAGGASYVFEMDADFSHDPADLPRLLDAVRGGADFALGSRYVDGGAVEDWGLLRRVVSRGGCAYARGVLGLHVRDLTGGFKCFRSEVLEAIHLDSVRSHGYGFQVELTQRALQHGFVVAEVPITFRNRRLGHSKMSPWIALEAFFVLPALRSRNGTDRSMSDR
jgi:dolichol-phosphate mannosyltransferase